MPEGFPRSSPLSPLDSPPCRSFQFHAGAIRTEGAGVAARAHRFAVERPYRTSRF